jgi:two-component system cell cycle sensor histidine kinase/response regulator CckA
VSATPVSLNHNLASRRVDLPPGPYVCLEVRDTGQGMDEATRAHIFEPFFTTKPVGKGTGLGMSTVYGIVQQSNGAIDIVSAPGKGTTVSIFLPLTTGQASVASARPEQPESIQRSGTVLVVDDDRAICHFASRVLQRAGFDVMTALNPGEALLIAEQQGGDLDLLLTDVVMSHMNGRELSRRLGEMLPELRVAYMSGYTDDILLQNAVAGGEVQLLRKPFGADALVRTVRAVLDSPTSSGRA